MLYWNAFKDLIDIPFYWLDAAQSELDELPEKKRTYGPHWRQYYLLRPAPERSRIERIVFLHGGGWQFGSPESFRHHAQIFNQLGFDVILPSLRRLPFYHYGHMREDLGLLMQALQAEMAQEEKAIILGGVSAGGHLASLFASDTDLHEQVGWKQDWIKGVFALGAPLAIEALPWGGVWKRLTNGGQTDVLNRADPLRMVDQALDIPFLCLHGQRDGLVPSASAIPYVEQRIRLGAANHTHFHLFPEQGHLDLARWALGNDKAKALLLHWLHSLLADQ